MKKILLLLVIGIIFNVSCSEDFINLNPPSNLNSSGFYKTQTDMNQAVLSAYSSLRSFYNSQAYILGEIRSDNTGYSWLAGNPANEKGIDEFASPLLSENGYSTSCWNNCYNSILRANIVIGRIDAAYFDNETLRNQYKAEAKFIRALMYFWLNRIFGGIDLNGQLSGVIKVETEITPKESYQLFRSSLQDNYNLIVEDLKYAKENLPESYSQSDL
ncbi:MAG TPA: RagB/SusD family nutrient uptake outer membrane protein, partial [Bacteroidales bacterium]|nr:RagB/SusD family nutrient uptake outer membrane protein [Bacteroidales bacterium]